MRTITFAEVKRDLTALLDAAVLEPVCIQHAGRDVVAISATTFKGMQDELRRFGIREPWASVQAEANGLTEGMIP